MLWKGKRQADIYIHYPNIIQQRTKSNKTAHPKSKHMQTNSIMKKNNK